MTSQLVRCISLDPPCSNPLYALRLYKQILITALNERILWFKDIFEFCSTFAAQTVCVQSCNERFNLRYSVAIKVASKFLLLRFAIKIYEGAVSRWIRILWWIFFSFPFFFFFFFSETLVTDESTRTISFLSRIRVRGEYKASNRVARQNQAHESRTPLRGTGPLFQMGN